ncbi:MAG TPA: hypothetical protein VFZ65_17705 [Planctomycetota bacterium]|nr:hypothetical protein [Planctomycetota bacterium]
MTNIRRLLVGALCTTVVAAFASAQDPAKPAPKPAPAPAAKPAAVFVIANVHGKHEVMAKEALDAKNKQLADEYAKAMQTYEKDKKAAEAAHTKFDGKEPKKTTIETIGGEFPSKEAAEAALKRMDEKPKEKPKEKEKPKDPKKSPHK